MSTIAIHDAKGPGCTTVRSIPYTERYTQAYYTYQYVYNNEYVWICYLPANYFAPVRNGSD